MSFKSGFVSIIGRPNVGKSTLLNGILGEKVAIVSPRPQTTRTRIMGVHTDDKAQIIFTDTPGMHTARNKLGEFMNREVEGSLDGADVIYYMVDGPYDFELPSSDAKALLVINKIDTIEKSKLLPLIDKAHSIYNFAEIIPISARTGDGVERLMEVTKEYMPEGPMYYPEDTLTDQPEKVIAAELIRERIFRLMKEEVPFGTAVEVESMKYDEAKGLTSISAVIYCEKSSHKGIIIGKKGEMLKRIGSEARVSITRMTGGKVFLELWVKVKEGWRESDFQIKNMGFYKE